MYEFRPWCVFGKENTVVRYESEAFKPELGPENHGNTGLTQ